jgi:uncharacterized membrane protein
MGDLKFFLFSLVIAILAMTFGSLLCWLSYLGLVSFFSTIISIIISLVIVVAYSILTCITTLILFYYSTTRR